MRFLILGGVTEEELEDLKQHNLRLKLIWEWLDALYGKGGKRWVN